MKHTRLLPFIFSAGFLALSPAIAAEPRLDSVLLEPDRQAIPKAEEKLTTLATVHLDHRDPEIAKAAEQLLEVLKFPRQKTPSAASLIGKWRIRSIQAGNLGVFAYPFFPCDFRKAPDGEIHFLKNSGSQRSFGLIGPSGDDQLLFVGSSYYSDESPDLYSNLRDDPSKPGRDRDRVGTIHQISKNHLIMIFIDGELYELKR